MVPLYGVSTDNPDFWCILLELARTAAFARCWTRTKSFDEPRRGRAAHGHPRYARGMAYLHHAREQPLLHRDFKPSNAWFDVLPKLTDFGGASQQSAFSSMAASLTGSDVREPSSTTRQSSLIMATSSAASRTCTVGVMMWSSATRSI